MFTIVPKNACPRCGVEVVLSALTRTRDWGYKHSCGQSISRKQFEQFDKCAK